MNIPLVISSTNPQSNTTPLLNLLQEHRVEIVEQLKQYGAVLFRGFACHDAEYFSKAIELCALGQRCSTHDYDLARTILPNEIYTSSDLPGHITLPLHHEKPRSKTPPNHLYFCSVTPAQKGGGTLFAHAGTIWQELPENIQDKIIQHGVLYKQYFHGKTFKTYLIKKILGDNSALDWSEYFDTQDKQLLEKKLIQNQLTWKWVNNDKDLILLNHLPGALNHPLTHQTLWFNVSNYLNYYSNLLYGELKTLSFTKYLAAKYLLLNDMLPMVCHYGNGQPFSAEEITEINQVLQQHTWILNWEKGDFMIVDNFTLMHGKQTHEGNRLLYSCMTQTW